MGWQQEKSRVLQFPLVLPWVLDVCVCALDVDVGVWGRVVFGAKTDGLDVDVGTWRVHKFIGVPCKAFGEASLSDQPRALTDIVIPCHTLSYLVGHGPTQHGVHDLDHG